MTAADLFCGEWHPSRSFLMCTLEPAHAGDHRNVVSGEGWSISSQPWQRAARVDPSTIPPRRTNDRSCYFCGVAAITTVNDDVPTCGAHGRK